MTDNIIRFRHSNGHTCREPHDVLNEAYELDLDRVCVIGFDSLKRLHIEASCNFDAASIVLIMERFKYELMKELDGDG